MAKQGLIQNMLEAGAGELAKSRSARLMKTATRTSRDFVEALEKELDILKSKRDEIMEISAGIDLNKGMHGLTDERMEAKVKEYHRLSLDITMKELEFKVAKQVQSELITGEEGGE